MCWVSFKHSLGSADFQKVLSHEKMQELICTIFGILPQHFVLKTSVNSIFMKFIRQSGAMWWNQQPIFHFWRLLWEFQHKMLIRTSLDRLLKKINSRGVRKTYWSTDKSRDSTQSAWTAANINAWWSSDMQQGMVESSAWHKASVNGDIISNVFCSRMVNTSNRSLNETMTFVQSIFHNVWT